MSSRFGYYGFTQKIWSKEEIEEIEQKGYLYYQEHKVGKCMWDDVKKYEPIECVKKIKVPILIIHGEKDEKIDVADTKPLYQNANEPKRLEIIKGADHGFHNFEHQKIVIKLVVDWFNKWLK